MRMVFTDGRHMAMPMSMLAAPRTPSIDAELKAAAGQMIQHGNVLGEAQRMPEGDDRGAKSDTDTLGARGEVGGHEERVTHQLPAPYAEMMLGQPDHVEPGVI